MSFLRELIGIMSSLNTLYFFIVACQLFLFCYILLRLLRATCIERRCFALAFIMRLEIFFLMFIRGCKYLLGIFLRDHFDDHLLALWVWFDTLMYPVTQTTAITNFRVSVRVVERYDTQKFCWNNLTELFEHFNLNGYNTPFLNTINNLVPWCVANNIPLITDDRKYTVAYVSGSYCLKDYAIVIDDFHCYIVKVQYLTWRPYRAVLKFQDGFLFGYRHLQAKTQKVLVSKFRGYNTNIESSTSMFTPVGDELRICSPFAGQSTLKGLFSSAVSRFDPVVDCMLSVINEHNMQFREAPKIPSLVQFLRFWKMPHSWALAIVDDVDPDIVSIFSEHRRITNLLVIDGNHLETMRVPITLFHNTDSFYLEERIMGARNGKNSNGSGKGKNNSKTPNNNNNNNKNNNVVKTPAYPNQPAVLAQIEEHRDNINLIDAQQKVARMTAPPKAKEVEPFVLERKIPYLSIPGRDRSNVFMIWILVTLISIFVFSPFQSFVMVGPSAIAIISLSYFTNLKNMPPSLKFLTRTLILKLTYAELWLCSWIMTLCAIRALMLFAVDKIYNTNFLYSVIDWSSRGIHLMIRHCNVGDLFIFYFLLLAFLLRFFVIFCTTKKFTYLYLWSDECHTVVDNVDRRVDVHRQGDFDHYRKMSYYHFEYFKCPCKEGNTCSHLFKHKTTSKLLVDNELLSQLLGPDKCRPGDSLDIVKERMVRCIAQNSSINRDRRELLSDVNVDENTFRIALALMSAWKIRSDRKALRALPLNF